MPRSFELRTVVLCGVAGIVAGLAVASRALVVGALAAQLLGALVT
jgi:hypothetical protein